MHDAYAWMCICYYDVTKRNGGLLVVCVCTLFFRFLACLVEDLSASHNKASGLFCGSFFRNSRKIHLNFSFGFFFYEYLLSEFLASLFRNFAADFFVGFLGSFSRCGLGCRFVLHAFVARISSSFLSELRQTDHFHHKRHVSFLSVYPRDNRR